MPLSPKQVAEAIAASKSGKSRRHADGRNLYLVARRGRGFWVYQFRDKANGNTPRSKGLGSAADVTLAAARRKREDFAAARRRELAGGVTMAGIRPQAGPGVLFKDAAADYLATHAPEWTARHAAGLAGLIKNYAGPLAAKHVNLITTADVKAMLDPIWDGPGDNRGSRLRRLVESILTANDVDPNPATWDRLSGKLNRNVAKPTPPCRSPTSPHSSQHFARMWKAERCYSRS